MTLRRNSFSFLCLCIMWYIYKTKIRKPYLRIFCGSFIHGIYLIRNLLCLKDFKGVSLLSKLHTRYLIKKRVALVSLLTARVPILCQPERQSRKADSSNFSTIRRTLQYIFKSIKSRLKIRSKYRM